MKKIIALLVVMLAFGISANAQQKKTTATAKAPAVSEKTEALQKAAAKDLELMASTIALTEEQKGMFKGVFSIKHRTLLSDPNLSNERKEVLATNIEKKLKSVLDADQIAKLDSNPDLLKKLTH